MKLQKNSPFNNLYIEGLRQTIYLGILVTIIVTILNAQSALRDLSFFKQAEAMYDHEYLLQAWATEFYITDNNYSMIMFSVIVPIIMAYCQFNFLNKRKACDFYHAIPVKSSTLFIKFSLACMTSVVLAMVVPILVNTYICSLSQYIIMDYSFLLPCILNYILVSFLVFSAISLGMALTQNFICATFVCCVVLILPRFAITKAIVSRNIASNEFLHGDILLTDIFSNHNNLFFKKLTQYYDWFANKSVDMGNLALTTPAQQTNYTLFSYVYTIILALAIFSLACYVFVKRKSEITNSATCNKLVNNILRIAFVLPFCVKFVSIIFNSSNNDEVILLLPLSLGIIVGYFLYELILTKDIKKMTKTTSLFAVVIAFSLGYYAIIQGSIMFSMSKSQINTNNITSINLEFTNPELVTMYDSYSATILKDYDITDPRVIELVSSALATSLNYDNISRNYDGDTSNVGYTTINTKNSSGAGTSSIQRYFFYDNDIISEITSILKEDSYINNTLLTILPNKDDLYLSRATSFGTNMDTKTTQIIADTLYQEYESLTLEQKAQVVYLGEANIFDIDIDDVHNPNYHKYQNVKNLYDELKFNHYYIGGYKETIVYDYDETTNQTVYIDFPSYNSNDLPVILALYTFDGEAKYIKLNEYLPNTKKLLVDIFMDNYLDSFKQFVYVIDNNRSFFGITSLDDSYIAFSEPLAIPHNNLNTYTTIYDNEFLDVIRNSIVTLLDDYDSIDYDNLYFINFYNPSHEFSYIKLLLPFTKEEYETYLLNIGDYITMEYADHELPLEYFGKPIE